ncbi:MAG: DinB family protein [Anaerolineae bacterium]
MDVERLTSQMEEHARAIRALVQGVSDHQARWRPEADAWSILDVINHLAFEEEHDFRAKLDLVLHRPEEAWHPGDPARGVTEKAREREVGQSLQAFLSAREDSLAWLKALEQPDWRMVQEAPFGHIRAGDILAAWVAHDLLHLRQLVELHWQLLSREVEPYSLRYAGSW